MLYHLIASLQVPKSAKSIIGYNNSFEQPCCEVPKQNNDLSIRDIIVNGVGTNKGCRKSKHLLVK